MNDSAWNNDLIPLLESLQPVEQVPPSRGPRPDDTFQVIRGNPTHGVEGRHVGYQPGGEGERSSYGWYAVCGVLPTLQGCRCLPWSVMQGFSSFDCRECFDALSAMYEERDGKQ